MTTNAPAQASTGSRSEPSLWPFVALLAICILLALLIARTHLLVSLNNDRAGQPILNASVLQAGQTAAGDVTLSNGGLVPETYTLNVQGAGGGAPPGNLTLQVQHGSSTLYSGPMPANPVDLGAIDVGDKVPLHVTVTAPSSGPANANYPIDVTFVWSAHPSITWTAWWIWVLVLVVLAAGAWFFWQTRRPRAQ